MTARYCQLFIAEVLPIIFSVSVFIPEYSGPGTTGLNPPPMSTSHWYPGLVVTPTPTAKNVLSPSQIVLATGWDVTSGFS